MTVGMVLYVTVTPLKDDLISPNWIISYVRAEVSLPDSTWLGSFKYNGLISSLNLTCKIHFSSSGSRETEIPLLNPLPFSGLSGSPREEGGFNLTADTYKMLILGFQVFKSLTPDKDFHE